MKPERFFFSVFYCTETYLDYINDNLKRLKKVEKYYDKMLKSKTDDKKNYFIEYMKMYLNEGETLGNFQKIYEE